MYYYVFCGLYVLALGYLCEDYLVSYTWKYTYGEIPIPPDMEGVAGVCLGCIATDGGPFPKEEKAFGAHAHYTGIYKGWVCFREPNFVNDQRLRLHELAHVLADEVGHTETWRRKFDELRAAAGMK